MERLIRLREITDEFDRLNRELPGLSDADRHIILRQTMQLTREMISLLGQSRLRRSNTRSGPSDTSGDAL